VAEGEATAEGDSLGEAEASTEALGWLDGLGVACPLPEFAHPPSARAAKIAISATMAARVWIFVITPS